MKLRVTRRANRDLLDIAEYVGTRNASAAWRVRDHIERAFALLRQAPFIGRPGERAGVRELPVRDFPYLVIYRVAGDAVEVLAIFHTSQDPARKP